MALNEYDEMLGSVASGQPQAVTPAPAAPKTPVDEYAALIDDDRQAQKQGLKSAALVAAQTTPDQQAKVLALADRTKLPPDIVARNMAEVEKSIRPAESDYDDIIQKNPGLSAWLSDPNNAALASDDLDGLRGIERTIQDHSMSTMLGDSMKAGISRLYASGARIPALLYDVAAIPQNVIVRALDRPDLEVKSPEWLRNNSIAKYWDNAAQSFAVPEMNVSITEEIGKGEYGRAGKALAAQFMANAPQQAAIIIGTLMGYGIPTVIGAGAVTAAEANKEAQESGVPAAVAATNALTKGTIEAAFERLGTFGILKHWEGAIARQYGKEVSKQIWKDFGKTMAASAAAEGNEEFWTSVGQDFSDYMTGVNPEALSGIAQRALDAGIIGGASGGVMTGPTAVIAGVERSARARESNAMREFYLALGKSAEATKLRERLPQKQRELVASLTKDSPVENVYLPVQAVETYFQKKNLNPVAEMQKIGALKAFEEAKRTGGDVKVPLAQWADKVVGTEHYTGLAGDVKFDPKQLTANEFKASAEEARAGLERADSDVQADPAAPVGERIKAQLVETGMPAEQAASYAELYRSTFASLASRTGQDPVALFDRYGLEITRPDVSGAQAGETVLEQGKKRKADLTATREFKKWFGKSKVVDAKGKPLVVYHGTDADFQVFDPAGKENAWMAEYPEGAIFLTASKERAGLYGQKAMPLYIAANKVLKYETEAGQTPEQFIDNNSEPFDDYFNKGADAIEVTGLDPKTGKHDAKLYVVFDPERIKSVDNRGTFDPNDPNILNQPGDDAPRAQIRFGKDRKFSIELLKDSNLSSLIHETGHFYLEVLADIAASDTASDQVKQDYAEILKWFGVESRDQIEVEHHEKFARGFEAYLMEGKAPTHALRKAFARFRAWLVSIYRTARGLNVELTPEVRSVFDRLVASDQEIQAAEAGSAMVPLFQDPAGVGMTESQAASYMGAIEDAKRVASEELTQRYLKDLKREQDAQFQATRERVASEVETELSANPEYQALAILQAKPEGDQPPVRLNRAAVKSLPDGKDIAKRLPRGILADDGMDLDQAAEVFGFTSGDELVAMLAVTPPLDEAVNRETDRRMGQMMPDIIADPVQSEAEALKAVHNDKRAELYRRELQWLIENRWSEAKGVIKRVARPLPSVEAVRQEAEALISRKALRDVNPIQYQRAEARSGKQAVDLLLKGDIEGAFDAKHRQLLNHELYRAAEAAVEESDAIVDLAKRLQKKESRARVGKAGQEYLNQLDSILERFEFKRGVSKAELAKRASLQAFVEEQRAMGFDPVLSDAVLDEAIRQNYKEASVETLRGVRDSLKNIEALARLKNKLLKQDAMRELDAAADEAVASIEANSKGPRAREFETRLPGQELKRLGVGFFASHRKFSSLVRQIDGFKDGGTLWQLLVRPMNEAANAEAVMNEQAAVAFQGIFKAYSAKELRTTMYRKVFIPEIQASLTKMGQLSVALNWGNLDNRQKLMDGYGWNEAQVQAILDRLDERDWKFVQSVWDQIDSYWAESKAVSERTTGLAPQKVEAAPVKTKFGEMRGGYYPLKYDERQEQKAYAHLAKEAADQAMHGAAIRTTTQHGHRKERVSNVRMPVRLDFGVMFEHVSSVIHDQTHYEMLVDANRILGDKRIQKSLVENYGDQVYRELADTLRDVAAGDVPAQKSFEKAINWIRKGSSVASMGWNLMTALQQPTGLAQSVVRVGPKWIARGVSRWLGDASRMENTVKMIHEKSEFMRLRAKTQLREVNEIRNQITAKNETLTKLQDSYFWLISKGQMIADVPTWLGAYEKALDANPNDDRLAVSLADQAVIDSQGGGQIKDLASVQRGGPLLKLWTNFYSYFNVTYNLTAESFGRTNFKSPEQVARLAGDMLLLYTVPVLLGMLIKDAVRGDDSDDEFWERFQREQAGYAMGTMVGLREVSSAVQGFRGYEGPAGTRFFAEAGRFAKQVEQGEVDEALVRSMNQTAGVLFHYPAGQVDRTLRGMMAIQDGQTANPAAVLVGPPRQ